MPSVGAVTSNLNVVIKSAPTYTAAANDFVLASASGGAVTITLPASPVLNTLIAVKKADTSTNAVTVLPGGSATINAAASYVFTASGGSALFQYDGTNWQLLSTGINTSATVPIGGTTGQVLTKSSASNYDVSWGAAPGTAKVVASAVALGTQAASQAAFTFYAVPSIAARGFVSLLTVTADSAGAFDIEVRGAGSSSGTLYFQAIGITTIAYTNPTVWYLENDSAAQTFNIGIRNTSTASHSFTLTSLRVEKFA